jgi:cellulose biosynthesis protein BcsQ
MIIAGWNKGGSGKTTVATNLAVIRASHGSDVLLIDADDQETASDFTVLRDERGEGGVPVIRASNSPAPLSGLKRCASWINTRTS